MLLFYINILLIIQQLLLLLLYTVVAMAVHFTAASPLQCIEMMSIDALLLYLYINALAAAAILLLCDNRLQLLDVVETVEFRDC